MRKVKGMFHHNRSAANTAPLSYGNSSFSNSGLNNAGLNNGGFANSGMTSYIHPLVLQQQSLPPHIASWQPGQPVPQGWRLGKKGFIKPIWSLPPHLSSWQQGEPIPEGYRLGKRGLRPLNYSWMSSSTMETGFATTNILPAQIEIREKPAVIQEVIRPGVREEIQPVVHREREQLEIREEIQPIYEKSIRGTIVEQRQLAPEMRPEVRMGQMPVLAEAPRSSVFVENEQREMLMRPPIVEEVVHKKIVEEIQPVIHREVIAPRVIHETRPIFEKIVEAPIVSYSTLPPRYVGSEFSSFGGFSAWQPGQPLPSHVLNWQQGQPIPEGWRLGRKGFLKPMYTLPPHLSSWQQGQSIPEGYYLGKRGMLKPLYLQNFGSNYNNRFQSGSFGSSGLGNSFSAWQPGQPLPSNILNWQQGQSIPEGWRLGRRGFLKPTYTLPSHLSSWQQGQSIPEGYYLGKRGMLKPMYLKNFGSNYNNRFQSGSFGSSALPMWQPGQALPSNVLNWQQGQSIPEGWRLGRKGYLKPSYTLPAQYSSWQRGQPIPEGYRVGKTGMLKPQYLHNFGQYYNTSKFQQQGNAAFIPSTVQRF